MSKVTFIVVEPVYLIRKGIVGLINQLPNASVVREMESHERLEDNIIRYSPKCLVINAHLLSKINSKSIQDLVKRRKNLQILSVFNTENQLSIPCGVVTHQFNLYDSRPIISKVLKSIMQHVESAQEDVTHSTTELSEREIEILKDVALGLSNKEIADKNFISPHTVITHRKNITRKLGIKTVSGLTIYAIINKIISMEEIK